MIDKVVSYKIKPYINQNSYYTTKYECNHNSKIEKSLRFVKVSIWIRIYSLSPSNIRTRNLSPYVCRHYGIFRWSFLLSSWDK